MARQPRKRVELIKLACCRHYEGGSFRDIAKELNVACSSVHRWSREEDAWAEQWQELEAQAKEKREQVIINQAELVKSSSEKLGKFCLDNLDNAIKTQQAISEALANISLPKKLTTLDELATATKTLKDLSAMVSQTWVNLELAAELEEFFEHNQSPPEIEFSEYSPEEILEIRENN